MTIFDAARETMMLSIPPQREAEEVHERTSEFEDKADYLVGLVAGCLLALREQCYGGYPITDEHIDERARAVASVLLLGERYALVRRAP